MTHCERRVCCNDGGGVGGGGNATVAATACRCDDTVAQTDAPHNTQTSTRTQRERAKRVGEFILLVGRGEWRARSFGLRRCRVAAAWRRQRQRLERTARRQLFAVCAAAVASRPPPSPQCRVTQRAPLLLCAGGPSLPLRASARSRRRRRRRRLCIAQIKTSIIC